MAISRRNFLKRTGAITAGSIALPSLFGNPFIRQAFADTIGDRYLVSIFLDGGNDGLGTIMPIDNVAGLRTAYEANRGGGGGGLRISGGQMSVPSVVPFSDPGTGTALGFHPGLADLVSMYDEGNVAVIQGVGYPDYNLSHETSRNIWETSNPLGLSGQSGAGWIGKHMGLEYSPLDVYGITIGNSIAGEMRTADTSVLAIRRLSRFGFPLDSFGLGQGDGPVFTNSFEQLYTAAAASDEPMTQLLGNSGTSTFQSTQSYPPLDALYEADRPTFDADYDALETGLARDLREVAKCIYGHSTGQPNINARFFQCRNGGYDTHADQGAAQPSGRHYSLHQELAQAVKLFFEDMNDMGVGSKVTLVVWSEFSRRIPQNANGTDHGSQGPMFVIGEPVVGGVYGNHPDIATLDSHENTIYSQDNGNPHRSTDFRDVFGTVLKHWVNMPEGDILSQVMPVDAAAPATDYWTAQNFDMGFL